MELSKDEEARIERAMVVEVNKDSRVFGRIRDAEGDRVLEAYIGSMLSRFRGVKEGSKIVVDCGNGPGALVTPRVLGALGHDVTALNAQVSWRFPARMPEPTAQNLKETAAIVAACGADFGFAHDGDADRLVMIDSAGRVVPDSLVSIIALRASVKDRSGVVILSENTSSAVEEEATTRLGLRVVRSRIGKTFTEIEREGAVFATEPSKIVDPGWGLWEDGMFAAVLIADAISKDRQLLDLLSAEPAWHYRQVNLQVSVALDRLMERVEVEFARFRIEQIRRLDGLKLVFKDRSWIMFRSSGTEPKTRIYCESRDRTRLEELLASGKRVVEGLAMVQQQKTAKR
jgi:phosphomannomutase